MYKRILMPIDGSSCSEQAVSQALALAKTLAADLTFVYVLDNPLRALYTASEGGPYQPALYADLKRHAEYSLRKAQVCAQRAGLNAKSLLVEGKRPAKAILELEPDYDLVVIGTHGRGGFDRVLLGSVTEALLRRSAKPHLVIRCVAKTQDQ